MTRTIILACGIAALVIGRASVAEPAFAVKPVVSRDRDTTKIAFTVSAPTDVEVAVLARDGAVVRHLAAGVLGGPNPPPPPLKPGLAQELTWDGKDNFAKPVAGPVTVRVRAGMGARFGRFIGQDPYIFGMVANMVVGDDGNLYIAGLVGPANMNQKTVRVFTPEGRFLRTLLPFSADLPPGAMKDVARWDEAASTWRPRNLNSLNPEFYSSTQGFADYRLVEVSKARGVLLVRPSALLRLDLRGAVLGDTLAVPGQVPWPSDKFWPQRDDISHALGHQPGPTFYTASPDGDFLYLSGPYPSKDRATPKVPLGSIWRMRLDGSDPKMQPFVVIPATPDGPWSREGGRNYGPNSTGPVHGLAVDAAGNVYVTDREKNRVAVFDKNGKQIGEISVKNPDMVAIHPRTGAIYVIRRFTNGWGTHDMILDKFKDFAPGAAPVATFARFHRNNSPRMVVATSGERTLLWFAGAATDDVQLVTHEMPRRLMLLEDKGTEFLVTPVRYGPRPGVQTDFARIATDPLREEIYVSNGHNRIYRYNGDTGEGGILKKDGKVFHAADLSVGYDGLLYIRSGDGFSGPLERRTRDLDPAPFPATGSHQIYDIYGRFGIGFQTSGFGIGPDGRGYVCWMYDFDRYFVSGWGVDGLPLKGKYMAERLKTSAPVRTALKIPEERKIDSAIIGPVVREVAGLRVDLKGNIYLGMRLLPKGHVPPAGFENDPAYGFTGSVVKFGQEGGAVLGIPDAESRNADAPRVETNREKITIEGALAMYPGLAPFSFGGFGGNSSTCVCRVPRFDLDRYGRLALPNAVTTSVKILDNAGNLIFEIGKYGNFDSQYVPADSKDARPLVSTPDIPLAWPTGVGFTEKAIYICDTYNRRVVRADFTWKAVEKIEVK